MSGPFKGKSVNLWWVRFQTQEAIDALQNILRDADRGELDDDLAHISLEIDLAHAMNHICAIWHMKWVLEDLPDGDEHFARATKCIPNFRGSFTLVDAHADLGFDQRPDGDDDDNDEREFT